MTSVIQPFLTRAMALCACLGLGFVQTGCAHDVWVEPSVVVHSRMGHVPGHFPGHFSVQAQVGIPGAVVFAPAPQVFYAPAPPPRVVYLPQVIAPVHVWGHDRHRRVQEERNRWGPEHGRGGYRAHDGRNDGRYVGRQGGHQGGQQGGQHGAGGRGHRDGRYR